jgi:hypothetical protein
MVDILVAIPYLSENPKNRIRSGLAVCLISSGGAAESCPILFADIMGSRAKVAANSGRDEPR